VANYPFAFPLSLTSVLSLWLIILPFLPIIKYTETYRNSEEIKTGEVLRAQWLIHGDGIYSDR